MLERKWIMAKNQFSRWLGGIYQNEGLISFLFINNIILLCKINFQSGIKKIQQHFVDDFQVRTYLPWNNFIP